MTTFRQPDAKSFGALQSYHWGNEKNRNVMTGVPRESLALESALSHRRRPHLAKFTGHSGQPAGILDSLNTITVQSTLRAAICIERSPEDASNVAVFFSSFHNYASPCQYSTCGSLGLPVVLACNEASIAWQGLPKKQCNIAYSGNDLYPTGIFSLTIVGGSSVR